MAKRTTAMVCGAVAAGLLLGLGARQPATTVRAERIELVDDAGAVRAVLQVDDGAPTLTLDDGSGASAVLVVEDGVPALRLVGAGGVTSSMSVEGEDEPEPSAPLLIPGTASHPKPEKEAWVDGPPGEVAVRISKWAPFQAMEVKCPNGFRARADFKASASSTTSPSTEQVAILPDVPGEDCRALFKGGPPARTKITGGDRVTCTFLGAGAYCER